MAHSQALPLWQIICLDLVVPPVGTALWWLMSRGFASAVQGGAATSSTKRRQRMEFWILLISTYAVAFAVTVWGLSSGR